MSRPSAEWGLQPLGSDFDYLRTLVAASHYQPVGPLTLASNVRWGHLQSFGGQPPLTALDLFYQAGGTQTVRGYKQDSLSAYQLQVPGVRVPVGGTKLLVLNEELRFPLFWLLSGVPRSPTPATPSRKSAGIVLGDLAVGLGFGLRIRTPLAPIRLDVGFPKYGNPTGSSAARWHFSIGQIFEPRADRARRQHFAGPAFRRGLVFRMLDLMRQTRGAVLGALAVAATFAVVLAQDGAVATMFRDDLKREQALALSFQPTELPAVGSVPPLQLYLSAGDLERAFDSQNSGPTPRSCRPIPASSSPRHRRRRNAS